MKRHGVQHMAAIGRRGFQSFTDRYFQGDRQQAGDWLRARAHEALIEGHVDREMQRRLDQGEKVVCEEIPCLTDPDDGIPF